MNDNSVKITGIIAVTLVVVALIGFFAFNSLTGTNAKTIETDGMASIKVNPDVVSIYFNVETKGATAAEAKNANTLIVDDLTLALIKVGIESDEIQTLGFNVYEDQVWENNRYVSKGFKASHQIRVVLNTSETKLISDVIDAGVDAGAMLSYINFELSTEKQNEYKAQALKMAGEDAKTKAEAIAEGLDMKVGGIVSVSTSDFYYQPWNVYTARSSYSGASDVAEAKLATTSIQPGTQEVSANIRVVYKLR